MTLYYFDYRMLCVILIIAIFSDTHKKNHELLREIDCYLLNKYIHCDNSYWLFTTFIYSKAFLNQSVTVVPN